MKDESVNLKCEELEGMQANQATTAAETTQTAEIETSVAMMAKIGFCRSPSFSPDAKHIAFISNLSGVPQVWTVPTEGGWPTLLTAFDDPVTSVSWSPDGARLMFSLAPGGGMNEQIYLIHPDGKGLRRLTDGGRENNFPGVWTRDAQALTYASNRRDGAATDAYLVSASDGKILFVAENQGLGYFVDVSQDRRHALLYRMVNRGDDNLFLVDLGEGSETLLTPHDGPGSFSGKLSRDGKSVYLASNKDRDLAAFVRLKLDDVGEPGPTEVLAARDDAELGAFEIDEEETTAALVWNIAGRNELAFLDLATGKLTPGPALPAEVVYPFTTKGAGAFRADLTFSKDGHLLALVATGAAAPQDIHVLDRQSGSFRQVTHSQHAGVDLDGLTGAQLVHLTAHDGIALSGWLYRPAGSTSPGPLVLSIHGGPEDQERPLFNSTYQALLARGIAVFGPNIRGSSGFGKRFVNLDNGALRVNAIRDLKACFDYVIAAGVADPRRVGIMGGSYGGYMTLAGLTEYPELFAAGASLCGIVNFETFFARTEPWMAAISKIKYGDPGTQAEMLRRLSPIRKIDRIQSPTIVLHGANDTNVPVAEAEQVVSNLQKRGVPVKYILFPDEGHSFLKTSNRIRSTVSIVEWFETHLKVSLADTNIL